MLLLRRSRIFKPGAIQKSSPRDAMLRGNVVLTAFQISLPPWFKVTAGPKVKTTRTNCHDDIEVALMHWRYSQGAISVILSAFDDVRPRCGTLGYCMQGNLDGYPKMAGPRQQDPRMNAS